MHLDYTAIKTHCTGKTLVYERWIGSIIIFLCNFCIMFASYCFDCVFLRMELIEGSCCVYSWFNFYVNEDQNPQILFFLTIKCFPRLGAMETASIYGMRWYFPYPTEISLMNGCYKKQCCRDYYWWFQRTNLFLWQKVGACNCKQYKLRNRIPALFWKDPHFFQGWDTSSFSLLQLLSWKTSNFKSFLQKQIECL